jgi:hypothetical protein
MELDGISVCFERCRFTRRGEATVRDFWEDHRKQKGEHENPPFVIFIFNF